MQSKVSSVGAYIAELPGDRRGAINKLRKAIKENLPKGFREVMSYGMIGYVVPHSIYPKGYHCNPALPLPFLNIASQKNFIAVYHMGIYGSPELEEWFTRSYEKISSKKMDKGKSCIRFKKPEEIPYKLIGELASKLTPAAWIDLYEKILRL